MFLDGSSPKCYGVGRSATELRYDRAAGIGVKKEWINRPPQRPSIAISNPKEPSLRVLITFPYSICANELMPGAPAVDLETSLPNAKISLDQPWWADES
jgi:hypothetical protein